MKSKIKYYAVNFFMFAIIFTFLVGVLAFTVLNSDIIITPTKAELQNNQKEPSVQNQDLEDIYEVKNEFEYIETFLAFPENPVDFLDEILPNVTPNPELEWHDVIEISSSDGTAVGDFFVSDSTNSGLDLSEVVDRQLPFDARITKEPLVLIYHTHSCESYQTSFNGFYYKDPADYRSTDFSHNVAVVGEALKNKLEEYGIVAIHDTTYHDYPDFNGAYARSRATVEQYLEAYPSIKITIDLHRDSMTAEDGTKYKPTAIVNERKAAQMMILAGYDPSGDLNFSTWEENLIFALKLQEKASEIYPGLMRPLLFREQVYNMSATNASFLVEVGTEVNTFSEVKYSGELLGEVIAKVLI